jgi:hypothetical protein
MRDALARDIRFNTRRFAPFEPAASSSGGLSRKSFRLLTDQRVARPFASGVLLSAKLRCSLS